MFQREELAHANGFFGGVGHGMFIKRHPDIEIAEGWRAVTFRVDGRFCGLWLPKFIHGLE
jgi:hypothetical protein